ncbi:DUF1801 domain-containing protein [Ahrensia sp. R2A130]|uniref:DUF1801 domain-containing protein n=1 Tax=Ahrensia sp. R2A130 TaxID=744979 RepID=UPI0001E0B4D3|nr:DUF1801 domain-containing protein [Ahrensia sp. R2A130]EFL88717.1 conserved hypothetical protein [Ahrensia sp. R2A130]
MPNTIIPPDVAAAYGSFAPELRKSADAFRNEVIETIKAHPEIGELEETLKWGVPSYLSKRANIGSTIRIAPVKNTNEIGMFFICTSGLMDEFREIYPDTFTYHGTRTLTLKRDLAECRDELRHIIALALTSKLRKRK